MRKIYVIAGILALANTVQAQVLSNGQIKQDLVRSNYFLDASNFQNSADSSVGKVLGFPQTDLTKFAFKLDVVENDVVASGFDGVIVYNTATGQTGSNLNTQGVQVDVTPGFYYFSNPNGATTQSVKQGKWVRLGSENADQLWAQRNKAGVTETYLKPADANGDNFQYKKGEISFIGKGTSTSTPTEMQTSISGYGIAMHRVNNDGFGPAITLKGGKGTIENPSDTENNNNVGRLLFKPTFSDKDNTAAIISTIVSDIENSSSYEAKLFLGARVKGHKASTPYSNMIITKGAVGVNIDPAVSNSDAKLQVRGENSGKIAQFFNSSSTPQVTFLSNGHVGLGTETPTDRLQVMGSGRITGGGNLGGSFHIENTAKSGDTQAQRWTFFNVTNTDSNSTNGYNDGLVLWNYNHDASKGGPKLMMTDNGNMIIGGFHTYRANTTTLPQEKLTVEGNVRVQGLKGTGDRIVVADQDGVLKTSQFVMKATDTSSSCSQANAGAIHYKEVDRGGNMVGVFGFCTRDAQGNYKWAYNVGGNNVFDGTGAFGSGL